MPRRSLVYEVLIASPSDVKKERAVLAEVLEDWNSGHSRSRGISLQALGWELDAVPASGGRPQEILNRQLVENGDILLAVFWTRLGTPTGKALSGTVEEIEHFRRQGKRVLLYFSEADIPHDHDAEQLRLVKDYRKSVESDTLYKTFKGTEDLRRQATRDLARIINELVTNAPQGAREPPSGAKEQVGSQKPVTLLDLDWITPDRDKAMAELNSLQKKSFIEGVCVPLQAGTDWSLDGLLAAAREFRLPEFALEQGKTTDTRLSRGIVRENVGEDGEWYVYWACQRNGAFYTLASLPEEMRSSEGALSAQRRVLQIANLLVSASMFYKSLGVPPESRFRVGIRHGGLLDRTLKQSRYSPTKSYGPCAEDQVPSLVVDSALDDMEKRPWQLLKKLAEPLFDVFGFPLPVDSDYQHCCPAITRTESTGYRYRVNRSGSRNARRPVKWAFFRKGLR